ncbi:MAG: TonB-dependent receptor plug domain-containing protein, partial [bacterium]
ETEFGERWKFVLAGRYDTHDNYESQFSPRVAVVYRIPGYGGLRASYNRAFQAPEIIQQELLTQFGLIGGQIPIILRGNGHGFTMSDGTKIEALSPERNTTFEVGYKGIITKDIFLDVNAYWSRYTNFISPLTAITDPTTGVAPVKMGDDDIAPFPSQFVLTYLNFGRVNMLGLDLGLNVQLSPRVSAWANYSFIDPDKFDFSAEEEGRFQEIPFNTPKHKGLIGIGVNDLFAKGLYGSVSARFVDEYDFVAGSHRATKAGKGTGQFQFKDRGPLGGFTSVDLSFSYPITKSLQINLTATNILDSKLRESVGSPEIRRLILTEIKYSIQ